MLPTGTVTLLFTDIEGSTRLLRTMGVERYEKALQQHRLMLRDAFDRHGGHEVKTEGDSFFVAFGRALNAVHAAVDAQCALAAHSWPDGERIHVRIGIHTCEATVSGSDYVGMGVHRAARIGALGHGDQILVSQTTRDLLEDDSGVTCIDVGAHSLKDFPQPEHLYQLVDTRLPQAFPPLQAQTVRPTNLTTPPSSLLGRESELEALCTLARRADVRLITLTGPGGTGKTRLALQAAAELAGEFEDGTYLVVLQAIREAELLLPSIAQTLGLIQSGGQTLSAHLASRELLLVLDNFEQIVDGAGKLAELLAQSPRTKLIVTSREPLRVTGERVFPVPPLALPDLGRVAGFAELSRYASVRLFVERAQSAQPSFELTPRNAAEVAQLCVHLDGLPLAIELAAARVSLLSPAAMLKRLGERLTFLTGGARDVPRRQQTLRNTLLWSHELLDAGERVLFASLAVFAGGFTLEAAEEVCRAEIDALAALVDRNMVRRDGERFDMLETIRDFAREQLAASTDGDAVSARHAAYFEAMAERVYSQRWQHEREGLDELEREHGNLRAAWGWSIAHQATDALAKSVPAFLHFWDHRGRLEEGLSLLRDALESPTAQADPKLSALLLSVAAHLEYRLDRYVDAERTATRALAASRRTGDHDSRLQSLKVLGSCRLRRGRHADARRLFKQALKLAPVTIDPHNAAGMLDNLALVEKATGRYGEALRLSLQSLAQYRRIADVAGEALCLNNLGALYLDKQEYESAGSCLREGLSLCDRHGLVSTRTLVLANLAEFATKTADHDSAEAYASRALDAAELAGSRAIVCWLKLLFVRLALQRHDLAAARFDLAAALEIAISIGRPSLQIAGVSGFAEILEAQGELDCASRILSFAADHPLADASQRAEIRARLRRLRPATGAGPASGLALDELVRRIVVESSTAYKGLIATLRGPHQ